MMHGTINIKVITTFVAVQCTTFQSAYIELFDTAWVAFWVTAIRKLPAAFNWSFFCQVTVHV